MLKVESLESFFAEDYQPEGTPRAKTRRHTNARKAKVINLKPRLGNRLDLSATIKATTHCNA